MAFWDRIEKFSNPTFVPEGWYWLLTSRELKAGTAKPVRFVNEELVVYRSENGEVHALEAHCPHMGAHLCDGKVEGDSIRCPFHFWKFNSSGQCEEIPAQKDTSIVPPLRRFQVREDYGLIWLWTGDAANVEPLPEIPELQGKKLETKLGKPFTKNCHPNVMMINAIDAQHFRSVHNLVVELNLEPKRLSSKCIQFSNTTPLPQTNFFLRWAGRFYAKALTYEMTYWWGNTGSVMVGPDFLHFYIIFALRPTADGLAEGQTILLTPERKFFGGRLLNHILLFATKLVGNYFAKGDTIIFSRIRYRLQTPIRADRAIVEFIQHYEEQSASSYGKAQGRKKEWPKEIQINH